MTVIIDGTNGVSTPNTFAFKNRIIDGGFTINQRGYVSGTSLSSGSYGHDRWKGGASNGTYTFTQASTGVNTTITITAGSIIQVIEGANLPEGGTYVLSWTGTAQGKIGAGSFGASGITGTITAGTNTNIEFNTGTCGNVQLEVGSTATSFDYRPYGTELALCQRYYETSFNLGTTPQAGIAFANSSGHNVTSYGATTSRFGNIPFAVSKRTAPAITFYRTSLSASNDSSWQWFNGSAWTNTATATVIVNATCQSFQAEVTSASMTSNYSYIAAGNWAASSEL
jgi:hypothetical protein